MCWIRMCICTHCYLVPWSHPRMGCLCVALNRNIFGVKLPWGVIWGGSFSFYFCFFFRHKEYKEERWIIIHLRLIRLFLKLCVLERYCVNDPLRTNLNKDWRNWNQIDFPRNFVRTISNVIFFRWESLWHLEMFQWILWITAIPGGKTGRQTRWGAENGWFYQSTTVTRGVQ